MHTNVTITCPGPSLSRLTADDLASATQIIAINRSVLKAVDLLGWHDPRLMWAVLDRPLYDRMNADHPKISQVRILTLPSRVAEWGITQPVTTCDVAEIIAKDGCGLFTMPMVLAYAQSLKPDRIDVFGCDMTSAPDWDGVSLESNSRGEDRWMREREQLRRWLDHRVVFHR